VREEVKVRKEIDRETVDVEETLRREELDVQTDGTPVIDQTSR
jgi:stress response protein YsnF